MEHGDHHKSLGYVFAGSASYCLLRWSDSQFCVGCTFNGGFKVPLVLKDNSNGSLERHYSQNSL